MRSIENNRGRNVYILGAGFSKEAGLPVMASFLETARHAIDWLENQGRTKEAKSVRVLLDFRGKATSATFRGVRIDIDNIEELFSLASATGDRKLEATCTRAIAAVLYYAKRTSDQLCCFLTPERGRRPLSSWHPLAGRLAKPRNYLAWVYDYYASILGGRVKAGNRGSYDTIITLNYDLVLEEALRNLRIPFNYGLPTKDIVFDPSAFWIKRRYYRDSVEILKLHGSLNWVAPMEKPRLLPLKGIPSLDRLDAAAIYSMAVYIFGSYVNILKAGKIPLLLPPTWRKTFGMQLSVVWRRALASIQQADRIVVVGYSFPETDLHIRYLLAAGLMTSRRSPSIWVVNPQKGLERKIRTTFWGNTRPQFGPRLHFVRRTAAHFFFSPSWIQKIGRNRSWFTGTLRVAQRGIN